MKEKKKPLWYYLKRDKFIYLLMLPGLLWYVIFCYLPMFGIVIAFEDYKPFFGIEGIFTAEWVGFKHFIKFFSVCILFPAYKKYAAPERIFTDLEFSAGDHTGAFYQRITGAQI